MAKPRAEYSMRSLSYACTETPGVLRSTSPMSCEPWSSMAWRVITLTDWGVSRRVSGSLVAVVEPPVV
ncbi:hypothetical protein D3C80_1781670 [compost metagenome]